jgi:hypothetical protein
MLETNVPFYQREEIFTTASSNLSCFISWTSFKKGSQNEIGLFLWNQVFQGDLCYLQPGSKARRHNPCWHKQPCHNCNHFLEVQVSRHHQIAHISLLLPLSTQEFSVVFVKGPFRVITTLGNRDNIYADIMDLQHIFKVHAASVLYF